MPGVGLELMTLISRAGCSTDELARHPLRGYVCTPNRNIPWPRLLSFPLSAIPVEATFVAGQFSPPARCVTSGKSLDLFVP